MSSRNQPIPTRSCRAGQAVQAELEGTRVLEALRALQFGTLEITVHQSRIVQITRSEEAALLDRRVFDQFPRSPPKTDRADRTTGGIDCSPSG